MEKWVILFIIPCSIGMTIRDEGRSIHVHVDLHGIHSNQLGGYFRRGPHRDSRLTGTPTRGHHSGTDRSATIPESERQFHSVNKILDGFSNYIRRPSSDGTEHALPVGGTRSRNVLTFI